METKSGKKIRDLRVKYWRGRPTKRHFKLMRRLHQKIGNLDESQIPEVINKALAEKKK